MPTPTRRRWPTRCLNRHELTSQGAKARRLLIEGLLKASDRERFAIEGFPQHAMYDAVFGVTGIHKPADGEFEIGSPDLPSWVATWTAMTRIFDRSKGKRVDSELHLQSWPRPSG